MRQSITREALEPPDTASHLLAMVISHADAPIATWGALLLHSDAVTHALLQSREEPHISGLAILSTCSRTAFFAEVRDPVVGADALRAFLQRETGAPSEVIATMRTLRGIDVVRHLFRVAAGLESIALGEHEILGQVRQALALADEAGAEGPLLHRLLERAIATGARARNETAIGRGATTLGFAAARAVTHAGRPAPDALALVVGAGPMARQAARHLRERGFIRIAIANRSPENARDLATELNASTHALSELPSLLASAQVVVTAARVSAPLIDRAMLAAARGVSVSPLQLVDLGSPPNIEPSCATLDGVTRLDLDALHQLLSHSRSARAAQVTDASRIVEEEVGHFESWLNFRRLVPAARLMRETFLAEARRAVQLEVRRDAKADAEQLQRFADALVRRLLHRPLTHLHAMARTAAPEGNSGLELPELALCMLDAHAVDVASSDIG